MKTDLVHKALNWASYNRYKVLAVAVLAVAVLFVSCAPMTPSLADPSRNVTQEQIQAEATAIKAQLDKRAAAITEIETKYSADLKKLAEEFNADVKAFNARLAAAQADLKAQQELRSALVSGAIQLATAAAAGTIPAGSSLLGLILPGIAVVGTYAAGKADKRRADNVAAGRKDEIARLQAQLATLRGPAPAESPTTDGARHN